MKAAFYFILLTTTVIIAGAGALLDLNVISEVGNISETNKLWTNIAELALVFIFMFWTRDIIKPDINWRHLIPLYLTMIIFWWVGHDIFINIGLGVPIDYIGKGVWDSALGRIFQGSGWLYIGFRGFLILLGTLTYFNKRL